MTISRNPDANVPLGDGLPDFEGEPRTVLRDFDCLVLPAMTLSPAGVTELEALIGVYRNEVARYRLRTLDLDDFGIHEDTARAELATIPRFEGTELQAADWNDVAGRLHAMRQYGGYAELRKLCALLTADEPPACNCAIGGGPVLPASCKLHGIPCEVCGGVESCADDCGEAAR